MHVTPRAFLMLAFLITLSAFKVNAQISNAYSFSQVSSGYSEITGTSLGTTASDDSVYVNIPIGFNFSFNGVNYNTVGVSSNGFIWFGSPNPAKTMYSPISAAGAMKGFAAGFARNLEPRTGSSPGSLKYNTVVKGAGLEFVVQWKNFQQATAGTANNGDNLNFQIRLRQIDNAILVNYGAFTIAVNGTAQVGLRGLTNADFENRSIPTSWANSVDGVANNATANYNTAAKKPDSGLLFSWIPNAASSESQTCCNGTVSQSDTMSQSYNSQGTGTITQLGSLLTMLNAEVSKLNGIQNVNLLHSVNGIQQPAIPMSQISGNVLGGTFQALLPAIPAVPGQNTQVVYSYEVQDANNFLERSGPIGFEIGKFNLNIASSFNADSLQSGGQVLMKAHATEAPVRFTELIVNLNGTAVPALNSLPYGIENNPSAQLLEITNMSDFAMEISGYTIEFENDKQFFKIPSGTLLHPDSTLTLNLNTFNAAMPDVPSVLYNITNFDLDEIGLNEYSKEGFILRNENGDIIDVFAINGYQFHDMPITDWYGNVNIPAAYGGLYRNYPDDRNSALDWMPEIAYQGGPLFTPFARNEGLADLPSLIFDWSSNEPGTPYYNTFILNPGLTGEHEVQVNAIYGGASIDKTTIAILEASEKPEAGFAVSNINPYSGISNVVLSDTSLYYPTDWSWQITPSTHVYVLGNPTFDEVMVRFDAPGVYNIRLIASNSLGSDTAYYDITVLDSAGVFGPISGTTRICSPAGIYTYSVPLVTGAQYDWVVPAGVVIVDGQGTNSLDVKIPFANAHAGIEGQICVYIVTANDNIQVCEDYEVHVAAPVRPGTITGTVKICPGDVVNYSINPVNRATSYAWTVPVGIDITAGGDEQITAEINASMPSTTNVKVRAQNVCGVSADRSITVKRNNPVGIAITGPINNLCDVQATYTASFAGVNTGYHWEITGGAVINGADDQQTVTIDFPAGFLSGTLMLNAVNGCGSGPVRNHFVKGTPLPPAPISGPSAVCVTQTGNFSIAPVVGATGYFWKSNLAADVITGNGTTNVSITFANVVSTRNISVRASNDCGASSFRTMPVAVPSCTRETGSGYVSLEIYPVPAQEYLIAPLNFDEAGQTSIQMFDMSGRMVMNEVQTHSEGNHELQLDLTSLSQGMYVLSVRHGEFLSRNTFVKE